MEFTKDVFRARIVAGLPEAESGPASSSGSGSTGSRSTVDLTSLTRIPDEDFFIREAYRRILGRECDPGSFVNCVEMLRRHTPRRVLLLQLIQSEEARRRGLTFQGLPAQTATPSFGPSPTARLRRLTFRAYDFARRAWHAPFTSLDQKLTVILRELSRRIDELSEKSDRNLWTVSEKLDGCGVGINTALSDIVAVAKRTELVEERTASLSKQVEFVPQRVGEVARELTGVMEERLAAIFAAIEDRVAAVALQAGRQTADLQNLAGTVSDLSREVSRLANAQENANSAYRRPPVLLGGNNIFVTEVDGFIVGQPGEEWRMAAFHALRGVMEPGLVRRLQQLLRPGMTFVDVGANIGIMTLHAAVRVAPNGKVYSFEPAPRTFAILKDNVQVNGLLESGLIELYPLAVSDVEGQASLSIYNDNSGHNTLFGKESDSRVNVSTVTLDSLLVHKRVDLVKIDAEGAEPLILRGMEQILQANPEIVILIEFAPAHLRRAGVEPAGFLDHLQSRGFAIRVVDDATGELREANFRQLAETFSANLELTPTR